MSRLWVLAVGTVPLALAFVACDGSTSHSDSTPVTPSAAAGEGGAGAASGAASARGGAGVGGSAQAKAGGGGQAAGESSGGNAAAGSVAMGGSSNIAGMAGSAGALSTGGTAWIIPETPGAGWGGPQDPACPAEAVSPDDACTSPPGTRCSYPESGSYTLRCQCYTSSTGADRWWCQDHASIGYDLCPAAYPGNGGCPNIGDVTCYYVDDQDKLEACNCAFGTARCFLWGL
jgi:hypothetical protein